MFNMAFSVFGPRPKISRGQGDEHGQSRHSSTDHDTVASGSLLEAL